jgi:hypothetical protein
MDRRQRASFASPFSTDGPQDALSPLINNNNYNTILPCANNSSIISTTYTRARYPRYTD